MLNWIVWNGYSHKNGFGVKCHKTQQTKPNLMSFSGEFQELNSKFPNSYWRWQTSGEGRIVWLKRYNNNQDKGG